MFYNGSEIFTPSPASILYKSTAGRYRPVSYPDGPITARYRFIKNAYWVKISMASYNGLMARILFISTL